ncbi:MAG: hypothetical protein FDW93_06400 [Bergeyella sp.]|nr:hypothetical protein [Bergeyella sp.]
MKAIERIVEYIDYKGINNRQFEIKNSLSNGYIATQLKRKADLGESIINRILENCLDINPIWLLTGKGGMIKKEGAEVEEKNTEFKRLSIEDKLTALHQENKDLKDTLLRENRQFRKYIDDQVLESLAATHLLLEVILLKMGENIGKLKGENKKKAIEKLLQKL